MDGRWFRLSDCTDTADETGGCGGTLRRRNQWCGLVGIGMLNPEKKTYNDGKDPFLFRIEIPSMLSFLAERDVDAYVPGITNIIEGGYQLKDGTTALVGCRKDRTG